MKNHKIIFTSVCILFLIAFLGGCKYDEVLPQQPPSGEVSFLNDIIPIFNEGCNTTGCHGVGEFAPDLSPANAYNELIEGGYIDTNNPEESLLYQWMLGNEGPPMPIIGTDPFYNATILKWIQEGALDN